MFLKRGGTCSLKFSFWSNNELLFLYFFLYSLPHCDKQPIVCATNSRTEVNATSDNRCDEALSISGSPVLLTITTKLVLLRSTLPHNNEWSVFAVHWRRLVCVCTVSESVFECTLEKRCLFTVNKVLEWGLFLIDT